MKLTLLDVCVLVSVAAGGYLGYRNGPLKVLFALLALLMALVLGFRIMGPVGKGIQSIGIVSLPSAAVWVFMGILTLVFLGLILLVRKFGRPTAAKRSGRIGAAALGGIGTVLLLSAVFLVLRLTGVPSAATHANSLLYRSIVNVLPVTFDTIRHAVPDESDVEQESSGHQRFGQ